MLPWILVTLPFAASSGLKPVSFGQSVSAETLFPLPTASTIAPADYDKNEDVDDAEGYFTLKSRSITIQQNNRLQTSRDDRIFAQAPAQIEYDPYTAREIEPSGRLVVRDETDEDSPDDESEEEKDDPNDQSFDPKAKPKPKSKPKPPPKAQAPAPAPAPAPAGALPSGNPDVPDGKHQGIMQMDCLVTPEACQNACYYQNCVKGAAGNIEHVTYQVGYEDKEVKDIKSRNRIHSGVTVGIGRPCRTGPFGQKFWDTYPFNPDTWWPGDTFLQTDEWPMAAMYNPDFDKKSAPNSIRCSTGYDNGKGGAFLENFIRGHREYNAEARDHYKPEWARQRNAGSKVKLEAGDKFHVNFRFDSFDMSNKTHEKIRNAITYCEGPWDDMATKCMNDGRQFHLTQLRLTDPTNGKQSGSSGRFAAIYDSTYHNAYRLYNETEDIRQFHVYLKLTGDEKADNYDVAAEVLEYKARKGGGDYESLATKDHGEMKDGEEFTITGLPRPLKVEKSGSGCGTYTFTYGDKTDGNRAFRFRSDDKGADAISQLSVTADENGLEGHYCVPEIMTDTIKKGKDKGKVVTIGTKLKCSFPGW